MVDSAKGSAKEMEICMQQTGCFRNCTPHKHAT